MSDIDVDNNASGVSNGNRTIFRQLAWVLCVGRTTVPNAIAMVMMIETRT